MTTLTLRKVGGSTMLALSPALLELLGRKAGESVFVRADKGRLVIECPRIRNRRSKYSVEELLTEQKQVQDELDKDREWVTTRRPVGEEIL